MGHYLRADNGTIGFDLAWAMSEVTRRTGLGKAAQMLEIFRLKWGPGKIDIRSYYALGLWRRELSWERKRQFVSGNWGNWLHKQLQPDGLRTHRNLMNDKVLLAAILTANGFQVPEILATTGEPHFPGLPHFETAPALADFLKAVDLPIFGKPTHSSRNLGSFSILEREGSIGIMGDGREVLIDDLADEIITDHPDGYLIQRFITPHPEMAVFSKTALPTLRVVTIRSPDGFEPLYTVLRVPGIKTNVDDMGAEGCAFALVDPATGTVTNARDSDQLRGRNVTVHLASGEQLLGVTLPLWDKVIGATTSAHAMFPDHGNIGWDVAITPADVVLVEGNFAPRHDAMYQYPADEPFMGEAIKPKIDWIMKDAKERLARATSA